MATDQASINRARVRVSENCIRGTTGVRPVTTGLGLGLERTV